MDYRSSSGAPYEVTGFTMMVDGINSNDNIWGHHLPGRRPIVFNVFDIYALDWLLLRRRLPYRKKAVPTWDKGGYYK